MPNSTAEWAIAQGNPMTVSKEDKLLSDLSELGEACKGDDDQGNREVTQDPDLLGALVKMGGRCDAGWAALVTARTAYNEDQTQNKVVALHFARAFTHALEERRWLHEALTARLVEGRARAEMTEVERVERTGWLQSTFPHTHTQLKKISQKDAQDALVQTLARLGEEGSLASEDERAAFKAAVEGVQTAYTALAHERLDDTPISDALKAAFLNASDQRVAARAVLQGFLTSEHSALSLDDLLQRRRKRASKPAQDAVSPPPATTPVGSDGVV